MQVVKGDDGLTRCWWGVEPAIYRDYHDAEWGRPTTTDLTLFEKVCLEGFQAGLSWLTILRKRESFRTAFDGFDPRIISKYEEDEVARLVGDSAIVRHEAKIRSTINNARRALELVDEYGSLSAYFWDWAAEASPAPDEIPASTETSTSLSKDLKRRGWSFVGPTTIYAFMQSEGIVNDHLEGCHVREICETERVEVIRLGAATRET